MKRLLCLLAAFSLLGFATGCSPYHGPGPGYGPQHGSSYGYHGPKKKKMSYAKKKYMRPR